VDASAPRDARPVTGAIVAGGANQRFGGEPKGLRSVGGTRIIDRVAAALRTVTQHIVLIANAPDASEWLTGAEVRRDRRSERGSVVGVHTALAGAAPGSITLVVAWDMPFVSGDLLRFLLERSRDGALAVIPEGSSGPEPFCAAYSGDCLPHIERAIERGEFRMSSVIAALPNAIRVSPAEVRRFGDPDRLFFNVNSPDDLPAAERMLASG
jgi:molybdenum cofactor guanylyltransferase